MSRAPDAATLLLRAIMASAHDANCAITIGDSDWTRWASATFSGARHAISIETNASPAFEAWMMALPDAELELRGHLVADLLIIAVHCVAQRITVQLKVLTVED